MGIRELYSEIYPVEIFEALSQMEGYFYISDGEGFIDGYKLTPVVYKLANVYKGTATNRQLLNMFTQFEEHIKSEGAIMWVSDVIASKQELVKKLGAKEWVRQ